MYLHTAPAAEPGNDATSLTLKIVLPIIFVPIAIVSCPNCTHIEVLYTFFIQDKCA